MTDLNMIQSLVENDKFLSTYEKYDLLLKIEMVIELRSIYDVLQKEDEDDSS